MNYRHFLFLGIALIISLSVRAQFILTPTGLTTEDEKGYYVLNVEDKTQQELYDAVSVWIGGHFVSPKDVVSASPSNSQITLNAIARGLTKMPNRMVKVPVDVNFTWQILFKDGKIRFNAPTINSMDADGKIVQSLYIVRPNAVSDGIFKKDGKLVDEYSKKQIEDFFNQMIEDIAKSLTDNTADEW